MKTKSYRIYVGHTIFHSNVDFTEMQRLYAKYRKLYPTKKITIKENKQ